MSQTQQQQQDNPQDEHNYKNQTYEPKSQDEEPSFQKKSFPLLSLPPEIWITICRLAVNDNDDASQQAPRTPHLPFLPCSANFDAEQNSLLAQPALTRTCRLLREELLPYFYTSSRRAKAGLFDVQVKEFHCEWVFMRMGAWLRAIKGSRRLLKGVTAVCSVEREVLESGGVPARPTFAYLDEKEDQLAEFWGDFKFSFEDGEIVEDRGDKIIVRHRIVFR